MGDISQRWALLIYINVLKGENVGRDIFFIERRDVGLKALMRKPFVYYIFKLKKQKIIKRHASLNLKRKK